MCGYTSSRAQISIARKRSIMCAQVSILENAVVHKVTFIGGDEGDTFNGLRELG